MSHLACVTDCSTVQLHNAIMDPRIAAVVKDLESAVMLYQEARPRIVSENKLTQDNHLFVRVICTFKFPL